MGQEPFSKRFIVTDESERRYELVSLLGEGGMAKVYLGYDHEEKRQVAIKFPHSSLYQSDEAIRRFGREMRVMAAVTKLGHPNIIELLDAGYDFSNRNAPELFCVMEYFDGRELSGLIHERVKRQGRTTIEGSLFPLEEISDIVTQLLDSLRVIHAQGYVHRDIKPQNILWQRKTNGHLFLKLSDFGIAKILHEYSRISQQAKARLTQQNTVIGTAAYLAPEQIGANEDIDGRADLYAVGAIVYQMVTGRLTISSDAKFLEILVEVVQPFAWEKHPSRLVKNINPCLEAWILGLLERDPNQRPRTTEAALAGFAEVLRSANNKTAHKQSAVGSEPLSQKKGSSAKTTPAKAFPANPPAPRESVPSLPSASGSYSKVSRRKYRWYLVSVIAAALSFGGIMIYLNRSRGKTVHEMAAAPPTAVSAPTTAISAPVTPSVDVSIAARVELQKLEDLSETDQRRYRSAVTILKAQPVRRPCAPQNMIDVVFLATYYPRFPDAQYWAGECYKREGKTRDAEKFLGNYQELTGRDTPPL